MKRGTDGKGKFKLLALDLGLTAWQTKGLLQHLWDVVAENAPAGDIGRLPDDELACMLDWQGDMKLLLDALVKRRWLDVHPQCRYVVHEWSEHCEDYIHMRLARKIELFADGTPPRLQKFSEREREKLQRKYFDTHGIDPLHEGEDAPTKVKSSAQRAHTCAQRPLSPAQPSLAQPYAGPEGRTGRRSKTDSEPQPIGDVLAKLRGGESRGVQLATVVVQHSEELPVGDFIAHYTNLYLLMEAHGGADRFEEAVEWVLKCRDPSQRKAKGIGELHKPGGYVQSVCKKHLEPLNVVVPAPPIPTGGILLRKST